MSCDQIKSLNTQYKRDIIPGDSKQAIVRLPLDKVSVFLDVQDSIYNHRFDELFKNRRSVAVASTSTKSTAGKGNLVYHTIRQGETLSTIANKHRVTVKQIQSWNGMTNTRIGAGKKLKIYKQ